MAPTAVEAVLPLQFRRFTSGIVSHRTMPNLNRSARSIFSKVPMVLGLENYRRAWEKLKYPIWKRNDYAAIKRTTHYCHHIMRTSGMVNGTKAVGR